MAALLTSKQLLPIHLRLTDVASRTANHGELDMRKTLAATIKQLVPGITPRTLDRLRVDILDIANTLYMVGYNVTGDIATAAHNEVSAVLRDVTLPDESDGTVERYDSNVNEIYIDFASGKVEGICDRCSADDVADALERIARELRLMDSTPSYIDFDEGKISVGEALTDDQTN